MVKNKKTGVISLMVTDIDSMYDILLPFFDSLDFKSRKYIDYKMWSVALKTHKLGHFYLPEPPGGRDYASPGGKVKLY